MSSLMVIGPETPGVPSKLSTILSTPDSNLPNLHAEWYQDALGVAQHDRRPARHALKQNC